MNCNRLSRHITMHAQVPTYTTQFFQISVLTKVIQKFPLNGSLPGN